MKDLDLTSLRLFVAVCESRSISRVAEREHLVASSISKRLSKLEQDFGVPLLKAEKRGVSPTTAGLSLAEQARGLLGQAQRISQEMNYYNSGATGVVHLMSNDSAISGALTDDLIEFQHIHPTIDLKVEAQNSRQVMQAIRDGQVAAGILWDTVDLAGLQTLPYRSDQVAVIARQDHPLAGRSSIELAECLQYSHVGMRSTRLVESFLRRTNSLDDRPVRYRAEVPNQAQALRYAAAGVGIFVCPVSVAAPLAELYKLVIIPLTDAWAHRRYVISFKDEQSLSPAAKLVIDHLAAAVSNADAEFNRFQAEAN